MRVGNHFLYAHDSENEVSSLSTKISGLNSISWSPANEPGALGSMGRSTARITTTEPVHFGVAVDHAPVIGQNNTHSTILLDRTFRYTLRPELGDDVGIDIPVFDRTKGVSSWLSS